MHTHFSSLLNLKRPYQRLRIWKQRDSLGVNQMFRLANEHSLNKIVSFQKLVNKCIVLQSDRKLRKLVIGNDIKKGTIL